MREKLSEAKWPGVMCAMSLLNVFGSVVAISVGADRTESGKINPFFYCALTNAMGYAAINGYKTYEILAKPTVGEHTALLNAQRERDVEKGLQYK